MAWHYTEFYNAVHDRLKSDATLMALIDGVASMRAPDAWTTYVVTGLQTSTSEFEALRTMAITVRFKAEIINPSDSVDALDLQGQIAERIEGNWYEKPFGVQPDYGLARWTPDLPSWNATALDRVDIQTLDGGPNRLALGMAFDLIISKEAV